MLGRVRVFGPAYLDRVLRVDAPLREPSSPPLDRSVEGRPRFAEPEADDLTLLDPSGSAIVVELPADWPGPRGVVELSRPVAAGPATRRGVRAVSWEDDLGGMGAGFAAALAGELLAVLGPGDDPTSAAVSRLLEAHAIPARIVRADAPADWTLLVTSGEDGDKLAVGFRGCHATAAASDLAAIGDEPCDVRIVAGLPNRLAAGILKAPGAGLRVFAPAMRNVADREYPLLGLVGPVDLLCCNRGEWEALEDREEVAARLSVLVVTEGAAGSSARFTDPVGEARTVRVPAFPRARRPRDTNRAGEAFAAAFISAMMAGGWRPESCTAEVDLVRTAMVRASAAAALVLDRTAFGFPAAREVDAALARGIVD